MRREGETESVREKRTQQNDDFVMEGRESYMYDIDIYVQKWEKKPTKSSTTTTAAAAAAASTADNENFDSTRCLIVF